MTKDRFLSDTPTTSTQTQAQGWGKLPALLFPLSILIPLDTVSLSYHLPPLSANPLSSGTHCYVSYLWLLKNTCDRELHRISLSQLSYTTPTSWVTCPDHAETWHPCWDLVLTITSEFPELWSSCTPSKPENSPKSHALHTGSVSSISSLFRPFSCLA